jgi:hypothetical protein
MRNRLDAAFVTIVVLALVIVLFSGVALASSPAHGNALCLPPCCAGGFTGP